MRVFFVKAGPFLMATLLAVLIGPAVFSNSPEKVAVQGDKIMPAKLDRMKHPAPLDQMASKEFETATFALG